MSSRRDEQRKAYLLGLGLDNKDGHARYTTGKNFFLVGGSQETHERMQETAIKINEKLDKRHKTLEEVSRHEFMEIAEEVGLRPLLPPKH